KKAAGEACYAREPAMTPPGPLRASPGSAAAGVVTAAGARVAGARALHHAAALLARRAELEALDAGRPHGRCVRERRGRGLRALARSRRRAVAVPVALLGAGLLLLELLGGRRRALVDEQGLLRLLARPDLRREDAELLLGVGV